MITLTVTDRAGASTMLAPGTEKTLMEALRSAGHDVAGTCGGACSCGTCHIYVAAADLARLGPAGADERDMLEALADVVPVTAASRLACQLPVDATLSGISIEIAPQP
ncbi:MAG: 2Fe-2S iron-sulfur cluster-binding protein [Polymorphobacter sp.]